MSDQLHATLRHVLTIAGVLVGVYLIVPAFNHPQPAPNGSAIVGEVHGLSATVNALVKEEELRAQFTGQAPSFAQPAVSIIHDVAPGLSAGQISALLGAAKPRYQTQIGASSKLVAATPAPLPKPLGFTPEQGQYLYELNRSALQSVLNDPTTKIKTEVTVSQVEAPPGRIGSVILADGSAGISFAVLRRKQLDFDLAGVQRKSHVSPALVLDYRIPHTQLGLGVYASFDKGMRYGAAAVIKL